MKMEINIELDRTGSPFKYIADVEGMDFDGQFYGFGDTKSSAVEDLLSNADPYLDLEEIAELENAIIAWKAEGDDLAIPDADVQIKRPPLSDMSDRAQLIRCATNIEDEYPCWAKELREISKRMAEGGPR